MVADNIHCNQIPQNRDTDYLAVLAAGPPVLQLCTGSMSKSAATLWMSYCVNCGSPLRTSGTRPSTRAAGPVTLATKTLEVYAHLNNARHLLRNRNRNRRLLFRAVAVGQLKRHGVIARHREILRVIARRDRQFAA